MTALPHLRNSLYKLLSALLFILTLGATPAHAIIGGFPSPTLEGQVQVVRDGNVICTGSLISSRWVLTAHHCFLAPGAHTYGILYGSRVTGQGTYDEFTLVVNNPAADVSLGQLTDMIADTTLVIPYGIGIPPTDRIGFIRGWGDTDATRTSPPYALKMAAMKVIDTNSNPTLPPPPGVLPSAPPGAVMLWGDIRTGRPAKGDSGAGMVYNGQVCGVLSSTSTFTADGSLYRAGQAFAEGAQTAFLASWITINTGVGPSLVSCASEDDSDPAVVHPPLRVMPLGDQLAVGDVYRHAADVYANGYRTDIQADLRRQHETFEMAGSRTFGYKVNFYDDLRNEGWGEWSISEVDGRVPYASTWRPNVVLLTVGHKDLVHTSTSISDDLSNMKQLVGDILNDDPGVTVILTPVPPLYGSAYQPLLDQFNAGLGTLTAAYQGVGSHVLEVDNNPLATDKVSGYEDLNAAGWEKTGKGFDFGIQTAIELGWLQAPGSAITSCSSNCGNASDDPDPDNGGGGGTGNRPALRLMPVGDSITHGYRSTTDDGYRKYLRASLVNDGFKTDFVGEAKCGTMYDNYNEGFSGYTIGAIDSFVGSPIGKFQPNIITLMLGTNDMVFNVDLPNAPARLSKLLDDIYSNDPSVTVLVGTIIPSLDPVVEARIPAFNQALPGVVQGQVGKGRNVVLVDMSSFTTGDLYPGDLLHPGDSGYEKIAGLWHTAIQQESTKLSQPAACSTLPGGCSDPAILAGGDPAGLDPNPSFTNGCTATSGGGGSGSGSGSGTRTNQKLRMADFDGDGKADYIGMADDGGMTVWFNQGRGNWSPPKVVALGTAPGYQVQLADFNGDGKVDYIVVHDDGTVSVWLNKDGVGNWDELGQVAVGEGPANEVRFADMDADGKADYMIVGPGGSIDYWQNRGGDTRGGWGPDLHIALGTAPSNEIQLVDFDGDGKADYVVVAADGSTQVWINQTGTNLPGGDWRWLHQVANGVGYDGAHVIMADYDGDGRADYLGVGPGGALKAWLNNGGDNQAITGWSDLGTIAFGVGAPVSQIQFAKIDSDKYADYLVVYPKTGAVDAYISHGPPPKGTPWTWDKVAGFALGVQEFFPNDIVRFGDMTDKSGYGLADYILLHRNSTTETIAYFYLNGGGEAWSSSGQFAYLSQSSPSDFMPTFTDMTGDGKADLVWLYKSGAVDGYMNQDDFSKFPPSNQPKSNQTASWGPRQAIASGVGPDGNHVVLGDFDGDKKSDYLTLSDDGRSVTFYRNLSGGGNWTWGAPVLIPGKVSCKVPKVTSPTFGIFTDDADPKILFSDVTGDNKADFLCVHPDGSVQAWQYLDGTEQAPANGWNGIGKIANGYLIPGLQ